MQKEVSNRREKKKHKEREGVKKSKKERKIIFQNGEKETDLCSKSG
jgi:hypothetical protein